MKKFLRFYLPVSIIFLSLIFSFLVYMGKNHRVLALYPLGYARFIGKPLESSVQINGREAAGAKVFRMDREKLLVYAPNSETFDVIIVDSAKNDIGSTNSGADCYELLFGKYLFQADKAAAAVYASDVKWDYDPHLEIMGSYISYTTSKSEGGRAAEVKVEILLKGE